MRDRTAPWTLRGRPLRVDVDPLMVASRVRERLDLGGINRDSGTRPECLSYDRLETFDALNPKRCDVGHGRTVPQLLRRGR